MSPVVHGDRSAAPEKAGLPVELLVIVAEFLAGDLCFGTAASLSATCRTVHQETLPVLFETTFWS